MNKRLDSVFAGRPLLTLDSDNRNRFEQLADMALRCETEGGRVLALSEEKGRRIISSCGYTGFIQLSDRSQTEILPSNPEENIQKAREELFTWLCESLGIRFNASDITADYGFMEYLISVFSRECMMIIKSGLLCGYASVEENLSMVQGNILFAENSRRNLVHKERVYVRHDVFTPDRAENRIIKAAAGLMMKLSDNPQNILSLRRILSCLDEVALPVNIKAEFSACINTRNTRKYSTVLALCRLLLEGDGNIVYTGRSSYAIFFKQDDITSIKL